MRQVLVLRIHTDSRLVHAEALGIQRCLEGVVITFLASHLQRFYIIDTLFTVLVYIDVDFLQPDSIVQSLLVDDIFQMVLLIGHTTRYGEVPLTVNHTDAIPALGHSLLPQGYLLGQTIAILRKFLKSLSLLLIELAIVIVQLALHRVVRSNLGDRVLNDLTPVFRDTILIFLIIKR